MWGDNTRIKIKGYLKNNTENTTEYFTSNAIKTKNSITYIYNKNKYKLKKINKTLILIRENTEILNVIYFDVKKKISSSYLLKKEDFNIEIDITTISIEKGQNYIKILYLVNDSNNKYEYYLEMSESNGN